MVELSKLGDEDVVGAYWILQWCSVDGEGDGELLYENSHKKKGPEVSKLWRRDATYSPRKILNNSFFP